MKYKTKLIEATLLQRYKRFFADIEYLNSDNQKQKLTIHVPNTGSLKSVIAKPSQPQKCWFTPSNDPARKLKGTLEAVQTVDQTWVGVNTSLPNKIVQEAATESLQTKKPFLSHWSGYKFYKSEIKISQETRLDGVFCKKKADLDQPQVAKHFIEIKNTTLVSVIKGRKHAQFPDAVTSRGQKHLQELMNLMEQGHKAELIFTIQRQDADFFSIAKDIDPEYDEFFKKAIKKGLIVTPIVVVQDQTQIFLSKTVLPIG